MTIGLVNAAELVGTTIIMEIASLVTRDPMAVTGIGASVKDVGAGGTSENIGGIDD